MDQGLTISCEAETGVGIELKLVFGSILWLRWKSCVACGRSLVLLCGSRIFSSVLLQGCFFKWLYQRFLTSLSVRPGRWADILSQLQHNTNWSNYHIIWLWKSMRMILITNSHRATGSRWWRRLPLGRSSLSGH